MATGKTKEMPGQIGDGMGLLPALSLSLRAGPAGSRVNKISDPFRELLLHTLATLITKEKGSPGKPKGLKRM